MASAPAPVPAEPVAVYRRTVGASLERVWENVLDFEHLPWLHRHAFVSLERLASSRQGWRVRTAIPGPAGPRDIVVELETFRDEARYVARTREGPGTGTGTEIWTSLRDEGEATAIEVGFHVPDLAADARDVVGRGYVALYTRLWDEDEAMMQRRQAVLDGGLFRAAPAAGGAHALGPVAALRERLPLVVEAGGVPLRVVACGDELWAHSFVCPHLGGPLEESTEHEDCVRCPWHGHAFDVRTGASRDGRPARLPFARRVEVDAAGEARIPLG